MENTLSNIAFDMPKNQSNVIKVIGVGGGGSNAINHMFSQGIKGVDFVVCNTDAQALQNSAVPNKIQLGVHLTEGLGAGANPEVGQQSALESIEEIEQLLDTNTKMVFITAGMGGGTGTGAAPVIAKLSKERDILTVGIVTIPFQFEGKVRQEQALKGVENLRKVVDSLIVINNNKLREVYGNLGFKAGFSKADEVLSTASRGIAEVITHHYTQNIDLKDAKTVLSNSGTAIMGSATASGETRAKEAVVGALDSPLLNDNKISGAKNVLLLIVSGEDEITLDEIGEINDHIQNEAGHNANIIMGVGEDLNLGNSVAVTVIATGFNVEQQKEIVSSAEPNKIIHVLGEEQALTQNLISEQKVNFSAPTPEMPLQQTQSSSIASNKIVFNLEDTENHTSEEKKNLLSNEIVKQKAEPEISNLDFTIEKVTEKQNLDFFTNSIISQQPVSEVKEVVKAPVYQFSFNLQQQSRVFESEMAVNTAVSSKELNQEREQSIENNVSTEKDEIVRYSLEDYMEVENQLMQSAPISFPQSESREPEFTLTVKEEQLPTMMQDSLEEISPMDASINDILKSRAEERKKKMKDFNYKFHSANSFNDLEKEPAYKRSGVDLHTMHGSGVSRTSLSSDRNNELQLRNNNSFLHDNVD